MTIARVTPATYAVMNDRIRVEAVDPDTWPNGTAKATALIRFPDAQVLVAINEALRFLQKDRAIYDPAPDLHAYDLTYSSDPMDLPAQISGTDQIWKVEYMTGTSASSSGLLVDYVSHAEIGDWTSPYGTMRPFKFTLEALPLTGSPTSDYPRLRIRIRPSPVATGTFRIWYLEAPLIVAADADAHDYFGKWQDLVVLLATKNLLRRDDEFSMQQAEALADELKLWDKARGSHRGSQQIRRRRIGRS